MLWRPCQGFASQYSPEILLLHCSAVSVRYWSMGLLFGKAPFLCRFHQTFLYREMGTHPHHHKPDASIAHLPATILHLVAQLALHYLHLAKKQAAF
ncbi:hypothetical protein THS27_07280 [Thalassospira sp. MCCC 1A01428]|nr:hypothetical protein THS27_07280 [Thalassospira sp. MCCC 1A01428]